MHIPHMLSANHMMQPTVTIFHQENIHTNAQPASYRVMPNEPAKDDKRNYRISKKATVQQQDQMFKPSSSPPRMSQPAKSSISKLPKIAQPNRQHYSSKQSVSASNGPSKQQISTNNLYMGGSSYQKNDINNIDQSVKEILKFLGDARGANGKGNVLDQRLTKENFN